MTSFLERGNYATFAANVGSLSSSSSSSITAQRRIATILVPETIKRRSPTKHYVYKIVVEWNDGNKTTIYRRYTALFDFLVKLQELYSNLCQRDASFSENAPQLPEIPGKILFGRSEIHQVAEKRRVKIEEFCQALISLPPEISESHIVLGFFNTWPDDTLSHRDSHVIRRSSSPTTAITSTVTPVPFPTSPVSPTTTSLTATAQFSTEAVISHPDEMENLEQWRAVADYNRKDSHQVDLICGQTVYVIEKHDTGWWMVMVEDEQGYAPASYLEPVEESSDPSQQEDDSGDYEAMESYLPQNDDEIGLKAGDRVEVISKTMDGWWKIRCNGKVGFSPSTLIRRVVSYTVPADAYESEKSIYEGLNIHRPPPRLNSMEKEKVKKPTYDTPRANPLLVKLVGGGNSDYIEPASDSGSDQEGEYYRVPRPSLVSGEEDASVTVNGYTTVRHAGSEVSPMSPTRFHDPVHTSATKGSAWKPKPVVKSHNSLSASAEHVSPTLPSTPSPTHQTPNSSITEGSSYHGDDLENSAIYDCVPEDYGCKDGTSDDYENFSVGSISALIAPPSIAPLPSIVPQPTISTASNEAVKRSLLPRLMAGDGEDYVDMDDDDVYVNPEELRRNDSIGVGNGGSASPTTPARWSPTAVEKDPTLHVPVPPPLPTTAPPKTRPKVVWPHPPSHPPTPRISAPAPAPHPVPPYTVASHTTPPHTSSAHTVTPHTASTYILTNPKLDSVDEEYIEMEPIYTPVPKEDDDDLVDGLDIPSKVTPQPHVLPPTVKPKPAAKPLPIVPPPYAKSKRDHTSTSAVVEETSSKPKSNLVRTKSLEDLLQEYVVPSPGRRSPGQQASPPMTRKQFNTKSQHPILPSPLKKQIEGFRHFNGVDSPDGAIAPKPQPARFLAGKSHKPLHNGHGYRKATSTGAIQEATPNDSLAGSPSMTQAPSPHPMLTKTRSDTNVFGNQKNASKDDDDVFVARTYVAMADYTSQDEGCLSFSAGDKCLFIQRASNGWWLVNLGGREGWTPADFWQEEKRSQTVSTVKPPPSVAPQRLPERKPRSRTTGDIFSVLPDSSPNPFEVGRRAEASHGQGTSSECAMPSGPFQSSAKSSSPPLPISAKPVTGRKGPPPPKPKPLVCAGSPLNPRRMTEKPVVAQKPVVAKRGSVSPPRHRRGSNEKTPSPPPPASTAESGFDSSGEYIMFQEVITEKQQFGGEATPWFLGKMEREKAEKILKEYGRQREFLVRERTTKDGYYALSLRFHYSFRHFNIDPTTDGRYVMGQNTFSSIDEVIHHYQHNSLFVHDGQHVTLGQPITKRAKHL